MPRVVRMDEGHAYCTYRFLFCYERNISELFSSAESVGLFYSIRGIKWWPKCSVGVISTQVALTWRFARYIPGEHTLGSPWLTFSLFVSHYWNLFLLPFFVTFSNFDSNILAASSMTGTISFNFNKLKVEVKMDRTRFQSSSLAPNKLLFKRRRRRHPRGFQGRSGVLVPIHD